MSVGPDNSTRERLEERIKWYDRKSITNQYFYKIGKIFEVIAAALIPVISGFPTFFPNSSIITASLGALIVVLESLQGLFQFHSNWISYRSTCEGLRHEKYLWLAKAGDYAGKDDPDRLLADRIEVLIYAENAKWISIQEKTSTKVETPITGR